MFLPQEKYSETSSESEATSMKVTSDGEKNDCVSEHNTSDSDANMPLIEVSHHFQTESDTIS